MFNLPLDESFVLFFSLAALASLAMIVYGVRIEHSPLRETISILIPLAGTFVLDACLLTGAFWKPLVETLQALLIVVVCLNWIPRLQRRRNDPELRARRDRIKAALLRRFGGP